MEEEKTEKGNDRSITTRNSFLRTPNNLSSVELNLLFYIVSKISKTSVVTSGPIPFIVINFKTADMTNFLSSIKNSANTNRDYLVKSLKALIGADRGTVSTTPTGGKRIDHIFQSVRIENRETQVIMNGIFIDDFINLKNNFTKLSLSSIIYLESKYSKMLYCQLASWAGAPVASGSHPFSTKQLKDIFGLSEESYVYGGKFNRKLFEDNTINKAIKEINSNPFSKMTVSYRKDHLIENGRRKVYGYVFFWEARRQSEAINVQLSEGNVQ